MTDHIKSKKHMHLFVRTRMRDQFSFIIPHRSDRTILCEETRRERRFPPFRLPHTHTPQAPFPKIISRVFEAPQKPHSRGPFFLPHLPPSCPHLMSCMAEPDSSPLCVSFFAHKRQQLLQPPPQKKRQCCICRCLPRESRVVSRRAFSTVQRPPRALLFLLFSPAFCLFELEKKKKKKKSVRFRKNQL